MRQYTLDGIELALKAIEHRKDCKTAAGIIRKMMVTESMRKGKHIIKNEIKPSKLNFEDEYKSGVVDIVEYNKANSPSIDIHKSLICFKNKKQIDFKKLYNFKEIRIPESFKYGDDYYITSSSCDVLVLNNKKTWFNKLMKKVGL